MAKYIISGQTTIYLQKVEEQDDAVALTPETLSDEGFVDNAAVYIISWCTKKFFETN